MKTIKNWAEVPAFQNEFEEANYWMNTSIDWNLMKASLVRSDQRESVAVTLRFDPRMLARIKRIARARYLNYQSMIKQWLSERLEKEI
ncbi:MAG: BrnA antitoxin family protein [Chthoniobacterales bacterium]|nr:BrnA antitoxin family protein [Chthoniobacterales bacterium]MCX7713492.1 BrnA antitoxin family protein [Chthoniobacterales bacterium]